MTASWTICARPITRSPPSSNSPSRRARKVSRSSYAPGSGARGEIDIEVEHGVVSLNGSLPSLAAKRLAGVLAWWMPGVRDVVNGITVDPLEEDAPIQIEEAVRIALDKDALFDASQIRVGVRGRTVRLTGWVPTAAVRYAAEWDAWYVFGMDDVINEIETGS